MFHVKIWYTEAFSGERALLTEFDFAYLIPSLEPDVYNNDIKILDFFDLTDQCIYSEIACSCLYEYEFTETGD